MMLDGAMGEAAISGYGDVGYLSADGTWHFPGPDPTLWPWICALTLVQGGLALTIIRLRDPRDPNGTLIANHPPSTQF
jgi:hypothetical protein